LIFNKERTSVMMKILSDPESADVIAGNLKPWRSAAECIDFDQPSRSIYLLPKERPGDEHAASRGEGAVETRADCGEAVHRGSVALANVSGPVG
jgi:hypothetical protein